MKFEFEPYTLFRVPNEHGFRSNGNGPSWPPPADAVFVFGGSTTYGIGVADHETIPAQLAKRLGAPVYNFAVPNYVAVQERIRLEQLLIDGHAPRVAIFIDGFDEFVGPFYEPVIMKPYIDAIAGHKKFKPQCKLPDPSRVLDRWFANAALIRGVCAQFDVRPLFVWQPVPCYRYDGPVKSHGDAQPLIDCVRRGYELMRGRQHDLLWLADMQAGRTEHLYVDADHYNAAFSSEIADRIAEQLS